MLPSHTVENYLKAIFLAQVNLLPSEPLVPMGQLASALGVVPGTATTMVKALAESGLVRYEPYAGVRLTAAGEKLAARVLRRHRLIELFLVQVMGMSWTEVHDEAEHLEHAVSDRLIERIDEMLGRPAADPHGDPIPGPEGTISRPEYDTLLTCPRWRGRHGTPRQRSRQRVSALRRTARPQARASGQRRGSRSRRRQRSLERSRARVHHRRARGVEGARRGRACIASGVSPVGHRARADSIQAGSKASVGALGDHGQLVPGRRGVQSGAGNLPEHLGRAFREQQLGATASRRNGLSSRRRTSFLIPSLPSTTASAPASGTCSSITDIRR